MHRLVTWPLQAAAFVVGLCATAVMLILGGVLVIRDGRPNPKDLVE